MLCGICLDGLYVTEEYCILTKCRHYYHGECIGRWLNIRNECPLCRRIISFIDCKTLNLSILLDGEQGFVLNEYKLFPQTLLDLKMCILFQCFVQHGLIFSDIPNYIHKNICEMISKCIEHKLNHLDFNCILYNFYRHYHLHIHFSHISDNHSYTTIAMSDIHLILLGTLRLPLLIT